MQYYFKKRKYFNVWDKIFFIETNNHTKKTDLFKSYEFRGVKLEKKIWRLVKRLDNWITIILANDKDYESKIVRFDNIEQFKLYLTKK